MSELQRNADGKLERRGRIFVDGPWNDEPDRVEFRHAGFVCLIVRGPLGALCGYVGVSPDHPWHGVGYDEVRKADGDWPNVHGGLTYSEHCQGSICHVPEPGEPEHLYWLGFDCAHYFDVTPGSLGLFADEMEYRGPRVVEPAYGWVESYKDIAYVRRETERLAEQAKDAIGAAIRAAVESEVSP